jgi:hypothetical protein
VPARLLLWTPPAEEELPLHYSVRAAFTWVFMPLTAALSIQGVHSAAAANALIASVLYDASMLARLQEGVDFYRLTLGDFNIRPLPAYLVPPAPSLPAIALDPLRLYTPARASNTGALIVRGNTLAFVGQHEFLRAKARPFGQLPCLPWDAPAYFALGPGRFQCCSCNAPVGGDVIVLQAPVAPPPGLHLDWWYHPRPPGSPLLLGAVADKSLLLCLTCWNALDSLECLTNHMRARLARTVAPHTQAAACAQCPGYEALAALLAGSVRRSVVKGAYIVKLPDSKELVLAGNDLGPLPALTESGIASLDLPVLAGLRLAEDPGARRAPAARPLAP